MSIFKFIKDRLSKTKNDSPAPNGYCPNCWGRQEYEGRFFEAVHREKIDLNNVDEKKGWIEAYAIKHLEGIKLKQKEDTNICTACRLSYKVVQ